MDPALAPLLKDAQVAAGLIKDPKVPFKLTPQEIIEFIFFPGALGDAPTPV